MLCLFPRKMINFITQRYRINTETGLYKLESIEPPKVALLFASTLHFECLSESACEEGTHLNSRESRHKAKV